MGAGSCPRGRAAVQSAELQVTSCFQPLQSLGLAELQVPLGTSVQLCTLPSVLSLTTFPVMRVQLSTFPSKWAITRMAVLTHPARSSM